MEAEKLILVRYGEIFLKSESVRRRFEKKLVRNIKESLKRNSVSAKVERKRGRIFLREVSNLEKAMGSLKNVFGIVSFSPCYHLPTSELEEIKKFVKESFEKEIKPGETFAIRVKRVGEHPYTSQELAREVGACIRRKVRLDSPDKEIYIEVRENDTYVFTEIVRGLGGLPVSTSGKVVSLISGGIDSPVASWLMMKRGCRVVFVHFHAFPVVSEGSIVKTRKIIKLLNRYQFASKLYLVPAARVQLRLKSVVKPSYRIIVFRRIMLRVAEKICELEKAKGIVTGESLAQVSSQTLDNLRTIEEVTKYPVFRPLVGMDKVEIVKLAKELGTYQMAVKAHEDCCQHFAPKHPVTRATPERLEEIEKPLRVRSIVRKLLESMEVEVVR